MAGNREGSGGEDLAHYFDAARTGRASAVVLRRAPGTGRTDLLDELVASAAEWRIVRSTARAAERDLSCGGLSALLYRLGVAAPRLEAATARLIRRVTDEERCGRLERCTELLDLLAAVSRDGPVLIAVDDADHLDDPSADALMCVASRARVPGLLIVLAVTEDDARFGDGSVPVVGTGFLTSTQAAIVLDGIAGTVVPDAIVEALLEHVARVPAQLLEVARTLAPEVLAGWRPLPVPLPPAGTTHPAIAALAPRPRRALALAALSRSDTTAVVRDALDLVGLSLRDLEAAEEAGLLHIDPRELRFPTSMVRSQAVAGVVPGLRRELHAALARALLEYDPSDRVARAHHLADTSPGALDPELLALWIEIATQAHRRGEFQLAAQAGHAAALQLRPGDGRAERLLAAARDASDAGAKRWAVHLAEQALEEAEDEGVRARAHHMTSQAELAAGSTAARIDALTDQASRVESTDPPQAARLFTAAASATLLAGQLGRGEHAARRAVELAPPGTQDAAVAATTLGAIEIVTGRAVAGTARVAAHAAALRVGDDDELSTFVRAVGSLTRVWLDDVDAARSELRELVDDLETGNRTGLLAIPLACLADAEYRRGWWDASVAHAERSVHLGERGEQPASAGAGHVMLALVAAARGDVEGCRAHTTAVRRLATLATCEPLLAYASSAAGLLDLTLENPERAAAHLEEAHRVTTRLGIREPTIHAYAGDLLIAYVTAGRRRDAHAYLEHLEQAGEGTHRPWLRAMVHRGRALLGSQEESVHHLEESTRFLGAVVMPFEQARNHLFLAKAHLQAGRYERAVAAAEAASGPFSTLVALPWLHRAERVSAEAARLAGSRPVGPDVLSAQERRVAELVVGGLSNREVAAGMVLSQKTIEYHLHNVYRKLRITSRDALKRTWPQVGGTAFRTPQEPTSTRDRSEERG
jgi:DNA-binding CsgD family transcriptional regulator